MQCKKELALEKGLLIVFGERGLFFLGFFFFFFGSPIVAFSSLCSFLRHWDEETKGKGSSESQKLSRGFIEISHLCFWGVFVCLATKRIWSSFSFDRRGLPSSGLANPPQRARRRCFLLEMARSPFSLGHFVFRPPKKAAGSHL